MCALGPTVRLTARPPKRLFHLVLESHDGRAPGADSEEKHEPVSDIDTVVVDSLKVLDPDGRLEKRPKSGHGLMSALCQSRPSRCSEEQCYSITSSARAHSATRLRKSSKFWRSCSSANPMVNKGPIPSAHNLRIAPSRRSASMRFASACSTASSEG